MYCILFALDDRLSDAGVMTGTAINMYLLAGIKKRSLDVLGANALAPHVPRVNYDGWLCLFSAIKNFSVVCLYCRFVRICMIVKSFERN